MAFEEMIFNYFFSNLASRLPWQPIKFRQFDKNDKFHKRLLKEHFCKHAVKIFAVRHLDKNDKFHKRILKEHFCKHAAKIFAVR